MIDRMFELAKDPDCIFALFPDGGGRLLSSFRPDDARLFYPTGRVNESYTNYPEIRKLTGADGNLVSVYASELQLTDNGYFYNASASFVSYIRFIGYNFEGDTTDKTFFARFYLPEISYSGTEANYYYARPFRIGTSSYPYTIEATMTAPATDATYTITGRWDSLAIRGNTGFEQGKWYTVALTKRTLDSGQVFCELWVNGVLTANLTMAASRGIMKETNRLETAQLGLSRSADCFKQDFAMIFDRVLSNEEIERYSNQPNNAVIEVKVTVTGTWDVLFDITSPSYVGNLDNGTTVVIIPSENPPSYGVTRPDVYIQDNVSLFFDFTNYDEVSISQYLNLEETSEVGVYKTTSNQLWWRTRENYTTQSDGSVYKTLRLEWS